MGRATGRFPRALRLRRSAEFRRVERGGRRVVGSAFVVVVAPAARAAAGGPARLGITVSRKVGNAVVRNGVKRRVREWFRARRAVFGSGLDVVVIGRSPAAGLTGGAVAEELSQLAAEAGESSRYGAAR
jgi:ribonuclease P protein component